MRAIALVLLAGLTALPVRGQCAAKQADADYALGMKLAHAKKWDAAAKALRAGEKLCGKQKRFAIELAGVVFEQGRDPEAAAWLRRGLRLDPKDEYANNFAGTVYYLMGNMPAALKYWNRIGRPRMNDLDFDAQLKVRLLLLDRAVAFSPAAVLEKGQYETTEKRVQALGIFPEWRIELEPRKDGSFDAEFHAVERDGFGSSRMAAVVSTLSGLPYETVYPAYYNIGREAVNLRSLLRWDEQKRRAWVEAAGPWRELPKLRWRLSADARDENWAVRRSFTGTAPVLGSLNLERQVAEASLTTYTSGRLWWTMGTEFSHRSYRSVEDGTALNASLVLPGYGLGYTVSVEGKPVDLPEQRFTVTTAAKSETARIWSSPAKLYEKLQGEALAQWYPEAKGKRWELTQEVRGGGLLGASPFDELFELGVERDNDLWLRGHIATRDGRKGSAPLGTRYLLTNSDIDRRIYGNGLIDISVGPLLDIGRMGAPTAGLSTNEWLFDTGVEARIDVLGTRVVLMWGHDLRTGSNAYFGAAR
ncbi:MAG TPA: hypothetical protein VMD58_10260 [Acidobacteriaceae bacterium]|nr:hypothetical protein [Acidobacteriaceae bacterium]